MAQAKAGLRKRPFGRTGHMAPSPCLAQRHSAPSRDEADHARCAAGYGVNHIDTAASYGDAELRIGPWMVAQHREKKLTSRKTGERTYARGQNRVAPLTERLRVDSVDLIQLTLVHPDEWDTAMGPDGALEASSRRASQAGAASSA